LRAQKKPPASLARAGGVTAFVQSMLCTDALPRTAAAVSARASDRSVNGNPAQTFDLVLEVQLATLELNDRHIVD
jgi:hypothetical protein